ncbi:MAG: hypothetical protein JSV52_04065 [Candidatus Zixiibacteriota bacterium]|nr:MAG: hypothetical protein JSV52_04065 [candidate division Zixibacteria bacterium]
MNLLSGKHMGTLILPLALSVCTAASPLLPAGKSEYDFIYDRLERNEALSLEIYNYQLGPFDNNGGNFSFGAFNYLADAPSTKLTVFSFFGEDFYSTKARSPAGFESLRGGIVATPIEKLFVYGNFVLDEWKAEDENYTGKKWRGLAGGVEQAFIHYHLKPLELTVGRFASFWGPRNSLVLSSRNALDGFGYHFHWGRLVLSYRLAKLDGLNPEDDNVEQFENRFFAGHRLDIHFSRRFRLGLFETVIFGGPGRQIDLLYLNPIVFFHADQINDGVDDNTLVGLDFVVKPRLGVKLYGQLLVDDFQIENSSQGDQEPDQYGMVLGTDLVEVMSGLDVNVEYSRVTNWTFNQPLERNRYLFHRDLIGNARGNDYETWRLGLKRWFSDETALSAEFSHRRQGEGRPTAEWTAPWLETEGDYAEPFPTGVIETTESASLRFQSFLFNHFYIDARGGVNWYDNYSHIESVKRTEPFVRIRVSTFFSTPINIDW